MASSLLRLRPISSSMTAFWSGVNSVALKCMAHCAFDNQFIALPRISIASRPFHDGADGYAGRAFGEEGLVLVIPGEAGDVEVKPRGVFGKDFRNSAAVIAPP